MSGSARRSVALPRREPPPGTTPFWYEGCGKTWLTPPPEPYMKSPGALGVHAVPFQSVVVVPQPDSHW